MDVINWNVICVVYFSIIFSSGTVIPVTRFKHLLLKLHNRYRQTAGASNMNKMVWDDLLSEQAKSWIHHCQFKHKYGPGENLAFDNHDKSIGRYIRDAVEQWHEEYRDYDYDGKDCHPSGSCHYTQMVWAQTYKVGCAMKICRSMYALGQHVNNAWYLACFYDPIGNDATEYPFLKGKPCSECLRGQTCSSTGLCTGKGIPKCEDNNEHCEFWASTDECISSKHFMEKNCRKACGLCTDKCMDILKTADCERFKTKCFIGREYMRRFCKKTCGFC